MTDFRPFLLERWFAAYEHAVRHQLSASDCEPRTLREVLAGAGVDPAAVLDLKLAYTETRGLPALRAAIAAHHPLCTSDDVLVAGAPQEAILLAMTALLRPGDRVVVPTPCYQSLADVPRRLGCEVMPWRLRQRDGAFAIDRDALDPLLEQAPTLVVTNFPHNPTGLQPSVAQWCDLAAAIERSGARWLSDEMYRGLAPDDDRELPPAASLSPRAISLSGLSKSHGLPGLRLGWLVARDPGVLAAVEAHKDFTSICSNAVAEVAGVAALAQSARTFAQNRARIAANSARMEAFALRHRARVSWSAPQAGPVSLARLETGTASALADAVRARGALLVPSRLFDLDDVWLRIGLGRDDFAAALDCWDAHWSA